MSAPHMNRVAPQLHLTDKMYIYEINRQRVLPIFSSGCNIDSYMKNMLQPTEYKTLQDMKLKTFPFIRSNITDLDSKLTDTYDLIHVSNIFDYLEFNQQTQVLQNMLQRVNVGGRLLIGQQNTHTPEYLCKSVVEQSKDWELLANGRLNVLQRVR